MGISNQPAGKTPILSTFCILEQFFQSILGYWVRWVRSAEGAVERKHRKWIAAAGFSAAWMLGGCNVFEPFASKRTSSLDYRGLLIRGNDALNHGRYVEAESLFIRAQRKYPKGSEAYLFHAQAIVAEYQLDFNKLKLEFECRRASRDVAKCAANGIDTNGIPFIHPGTTVDSIERIYWPVAAAVRDLNYILRSSKDSLVLIGGYKLPPDSGQASDGRVTAGVARLDLGLLLAINGMLAPLDMDQNLHITVTCGTNLDIAYADSSQAVRDSVKRLKCGDGLLSEQIRLDNFKKLTQDVHIDNLDSKDVRARNMSVNPNDINAFIASMQIPISASQYNLDSVHSAMVINSYTQGQAEIEGVIANVRDLNNFLGYMRYNDTIDDDYDVDSLNPPRKPTAYFWHNFDRDDIAAGGYKDHGIRYDYNDPMYNPAYPSSGDIGHPLHRFQHFRFDSNPLVNSWVSDLYLKYSELGRRYPGLAVDTSKNSRFSLMRKKCKDMLMNDYPPGLNDAGHILVCDSLTTVLRNDAPRPARSDWIGGNPGVDEEMIDEYDNDYDGIKDEDARNYVGYDDDDDALMTMSMLGTITPANSGTLSMIWQDDSVGPGHKNKCIDIDINIPMANYADSAFGGNPDTTAQRAAQRVFCMGTLEHRLYLARKAGITSLNPDVMRNPAYRDSLRNYYTVAGSGDPTSSADTGKNCMDDVRRHLGQDFKNRWFPMTPDSAAEVNLACRFKHIWLAPRPANSEWTSGVYGVDEEKYDCVDNDGDGWIDEDLIDRRSGPCWSGIP